MKNTSVKVVVNNDDFNSVGSISEPYQCRFCKEYQWTAAYDVKKLQQAFRFTLVNIAVS